MVGLWQVALVLFVGLGIGLVGGLLFGLGVECCQQAPVVGASIVASGAALAAAGLGSWVLAVCVGGLAGTWSFLLGMETYKLGLSVRSHEPPGPRHEP